MKNKKGLSNIILSILLFSVFIFIFLFFTVGYKQIFSENIIQPTLDFALAINDSFTMAPGILQTMQDVKDEYDTDFFNYDIFFLVIFIIVFSSTIVSAQQAKKLGILTFFGMISVGTWFFLLILSFVTQVSDWLILNLYINLFDLTNVYTPIIDFFISNISSISFIWFLVTVLVNQIDFQQIKRRVTQSDGRPEE